MFAEFPDPPPERAVLLCADVQTFSAPHWQTFLGWLDADEQARRSCLRRTSDRQMFLLGRALLRAVLGRYLGLAPAQVQLRLDTRGKPCCPDWPAHAFNLAHSGGRVVLAWAQGRAVGVDIEAIDPAFDWASIAVDHFSLAERAELASLPASRQSDAFFRGWTLKEAYGKAEGTGILGGLRALTFEATAPARYRRRDAGDAADFVWAEASCARYALALAVLGGGTEEVVLYRVDPSETRSMERTCIPESAASAGAEPGNRGRKPPVET